jgi:hypothetical protein
VSQLDTNLGVARLGGRTSVLSPGVLVSSKPVSLRWVFRPDRPDSGQDRTAEHAGKPIHAVGRRVDDGGRVEVVLVDGARVQAFRHEVVLGDPVIILLGPSRPVGWESTQRKR